MRGIVPVVLLLAACASPASRIKKNQTAFDAYPPEVQAKIREGRAAPGMTPEMVRIALGKPDRIYTRSTTQAEQEIWAYGGSSRGPGLGLGLGVFSGGPTVYGGGVSVGTRDGYAVEDKERVVFEKGVVVSVERRDR